MDFIMTKHALERAVDMALTGDEIRDAFDKPRNVHRSAKTGATYLTRDRLTLVVRYDDVPVVVTVMWATTAAWAADAEIGVYGSREGAKLSQSRASVKARSKGGKQKWGSTR